MTAMTNLNHLLAAGQPPNAWIWAMAIGFTAICLIMMLIVLIQKPKGGGLSGAFGGGAGGGSESAFIGGRVGDVLTWSTVVCFILFLLLAMGMTWGIKGGGPTEDADKTENAGQNDGADPEDDTDTEADLDTETGTPANPPADTGDAPVIDTPQLPTPGDTDSPDTDDATGTDTTDTDSPDQPASEDQDPASDADTP